MLDFDVSFVRCDRRRFLQNVAAFSAGLAYPFVTPPPSAAQTALPPAGRTIFVSNGAQLASALAAAMPGDHIVLNDGTYTGSFQITRSGTNAAPIVIRAANLGRAYLTGSLTLSGSDVWLYGTTCTADRSLNIRNDRISVLRNIFTGRQAIYLYRASYCQIGYNYFNPPADDPNTSWNDILLDLTNSDVAANRTSRFNHIFRNHFSSRPASNPASYQNANHGIYVATYALDNYPPTGNIIEYNLFAHDRLRPIYLKHGGNIVRGNTILSSPNYNYRGMMCNSRHGTGDQWIGNYFENDYGLIINGSSHLVLGNTFAPTSSCRLYLMAGQERTSHPPATDCVAAGNKGTTIIGFTFYGGNGPFLFAERNRVEANVGEVRQTQWARNNVISPNTSRSVPQATKLSVQSVGPWAI